MKKQKKWINYFIIVAILSIMAILGVEEFKDNKIRKQEAIDNSSYHAQNVSMLYQQEESITNQKEKEIEKEDTTKQYQKEEIPKEYKGYNVIAKLEIPKIDLQTYILSTYSKVSLNISVTKFWGADPNQKGNFCVAGHNFQNKNMFHNVRNLEKKDNLWVTDRQVGKVEYEIYDIYTVVPEDVKCLSQETNGKREITLITCTSDSKKRIIVKAKEKD